MKHGLIALISQEMSVVVTEGDTIVSNMLNFCRTVIPLQLLAYHIAKAKDYDVDQPKNLAKSVTMEWLTVFNFHLLRRGPIRTDNLC